MGVSHITYAGVRGVGASPIANTVVRGVGACHNAYSGVREGWRHVK